jgi:hypothetical protein
VSLTGWGYHVPRLFDMLNLSIKVKIDLRRVSKLWFGIWFFLTQ